MTLPKHVSSAVEDQVMPPTDLCAANASLCMRAEQREALQAALDAEPHDLPRIRKLFAQPSVFEAKSP